MGSVQQKTEISKIRSQVFKIANRLRPHLGGEMASKIGWLLAKVHYQIIDYCFVTFLKMDGKTLTTRKIKSLKSIATKPSSSNRKKTDTLKFIDMDKTGNVWRCIISFNAFQIKDAFLK